MANRKPPFSKRSKAGANKGHAPARGGRSGASERYWLFGRHAVTAALDNPQRRVHRVIGTRNALSYIASTDPGATPPQCEIVDADVIRSFIGSDAVHQGIAAEVSPLAQPALEDLFTATAKTAAIFVVLDQVTDPQNVGAILRTAAAFEATALIVQDRHAPRETGHLAKAASGALEAVPLVRVTNIARTLRLAQHHGLVTIGLDLEGEDMPVSAESPERAMLVFGAEGRGLRPNVAAHCQALWRIAQSGRVQSLNVTASAAIMLHHFYRMSPKSTANITP